MPLINGTSPAREPAVRLQHRRITGLARSVCHRRNSEGFGRMPSSLPVDVRARRSLAVAGLTLDSAERRARVKPACEPRRAGRANPAGPPRFKAMLRPGRRFTRICSLDVRSLPEGLATCAHFPVTETEAQREQRALAGRWPGWNVDTRSLPPTRGGWR